MRIRSPVSHDRSNLGNYLQVFRTRSGCLKVEFTGAEELFAKLYEFGQLAANDFEGVRQLCPSRSKSNRHLGSDSNKDTLTPELHCSCRGKKGREPRDRNRRPFVQESKVPGRAFA